MSTSKRHPSSTNEEVQRLKERNARLEEGNARLKEEKAKTTQLLDELRDQLLEVKREEKQVDDLAIQGKYQSLLNAIEDWMSEVIFEDEYDFKKTWDKMMKLESDGGHLEYLGLYRRRGNQFTRKSIEMDNISEDRMKWLGNQPYCNCLIVTLVIWTVLHNMVLQREYPIGMGQDDVANSGTGMSNDAFVQSVFLVLTGKDNGKGM